MNVARVPVTLQVNLTHSDLEEATYVLRRRALPRRIREARGTIAGEYDFTDAMLSAAARAALFA